MAEGLLIHIAEVADDLGLSQYQVRGMIRDGVFPSEPIGRRIYIPAAAFKAYKQRLEQSVEDAAS